MPDPEVAALERVGARIRAERGWLVRLFLEGRARKEKPAVPHDSILTEAERLVHGDRGADYGHPAEDFGRTAGAVSALLAHKLKEPLAPEDVALIMVCVKLSRQVNRPKRDNLVDGAGYLETWQMVLDRCGRAGS